jgi:hypothetical protein
VDLRRRRFVTMLVVAEARGSRWLAGAFDAGGDLAQILTTLFGAGEVIIHGFNLYTASLIAEIAVVSFFGTVVWTGVAQKIGPEQPSVAALQQRITTLEKELHNGEEND